MASLLQKLLRNQPPKTTLISNLNKRILSPPARLLDPKSDPSVAPIPFFNNLPNSTDESNPNPQHNRNFVYPSFAFELLLHPIFQIGDSQSVLPEVEIVSDDEDIGIWADSVKKKRKKKMNKHKLKKLRKRLRRKT